MATLTIEMIRKRAEHNDGILHSLEELSLNQLGLVNLGFVEEERVQHEAISKGRRHCHRHRRLRRSLLPRACRRLRHLSLAGNSLPRLPCGPRDLGLCKELRTLNVALNAIERIEGGKMNGGEREKEGEEEEDEEEGPLSSCESLSRLDLSGNFISKGTAREALRSLASAPVLESLWLSGCPVAVGWRGYRSFVVASLPRLRELDGIAITATERIVALEALPELKRDLAECERQEKEKGGSRGGKGGGGNDGDERGDESGDESGDAFSCSYSEADLRELEREADLLEEQMKMQREANRGGEEAKTPWSRAARLLLARETAAAAAAAAAAAGKERSSIRGGKADAAEASSGGLFERVIEPLRTSMPPWDSSSSSSDEDDNRSGEGEEEDEEKRRRRRHSHSRRRCRQCDDGSWPFALFPSPDGCPFLVLEVALGLQAGRYVGGGGGVELDVRPRHVRVFSGGSLLCARLPARVDPEKATATRSLASGRLVVEMPLADPEGGREGLDESCVREWGRRGGGGGGGGKGREVRGGGGGRRGGEAAGRAVATAAAAAVVVAADGDEENENGDGEDSSPPPLPPL